MGTRAYHRAYYQRTKAHQAERRRAKRHARYAYVAERKRGLPCADCGIEFPPVAMDWDHVRGVKETHLSNLCAQCASYDRIDAEIEKCELRCANCHRLRHSEDWYGCPR